MLEPEALGAAARRAVLPQYLLPKRALTRLAGAVAGGGLTVIANAPNPAGFAILRRSFNDEAIHPWGLFTAALTPTLVAILFLKILS